jgi:uncharacterized protein YqhQ
VARSPAPDAPALDTVGGMALVEGVMMRGPRRWAAAVRRADRSIEVVEGDVPGWSRRAARIPLVRGVAALADAMSVGVRVLLWSGELHERERRAEPGATVPAATPDIRAMRIGPALVPALAITIALFFVLPAGLATLLAGSAGPTAFNAVETGIRLVVLVGYLAAVRHIPDVRRVFEFHGAEHKVVAHYEDVGDRSGLTAAGAKRCSTRHQRCGTTFLLVVVMLSGIAHLALGKPSLPVLLASRAVLVPLMAAIAYELVTWVARRPAGLRRAVIAPGLVLQGLTTAEPDEDQLEVAIVALQRALEPVEADRTVRLATPPRTMRPTPVPATN